jgi:hypothetical protein
MKRSNVVHVALDLAVSDVAGDVAEHLAGRPGRDRVADFGSSADITGATGSRPIAEISAMRWRGAGSGRHPRMPWSSAYSERGALPR